MELIQANIQLKKLHNNLYKHPAKGLVIKL
jgi:hypothetical protein